MAPGQPRRPRRSRGEDPRDTGAPDAGARQVGPPARRAARAVRILDDAAARVAAGDLLSRRPWTARELQARLCRRGAPPEVAAGVVADLAARGYVDDAAFARQWVAARAGRGYGARRLRAELQARGVAPELVASALAAQADDAQLERARVVAQRRVAALTRVEPARASARLREHLLRRGFSGATVARVVREILALRPEPGPEHDSA